MNVLVYYPLYVLCVFLCACVISNQSTSKKRHASNLSKLYACQKSSGRGNLGMGGASLDKI